MLKVLAHFEDHADRADHTQREQEARVGQNGQQHDADGNGRVDEVRANEAALVDRDRETGQVLEQENNAEDESRPSTVPLSSSVARSGKSNSVRSATTVRSVGNVRIFSSRSSRASTGSPEVPLAVALIGSQYAEGNKEARCRSSGLKIGALGVRSSAARRAVDVRRW